MKSDTSLAGLTLAERRKLLSMARSRDLVRGSELPPIERAPREGRVPLSFAQQRLWFLEQLGGVGGTYHIARRLRLRGELDRGALARALDRIVARHEALRTTFAAVDGVPEQRIAPEDAGLLLVEHDLRGRADAEAELQRVAAGEGRAPFDLERGPLVRGRLVRLAEDDHVLLLTMHHIVGDAWSSGVLTQELSALYGAFRRGEPDPLPPLEVQYADYALWQRRWVEGRVLQEQADYWTRTLAGAPELLELPTDRPPPAQMDPAGSHLAVELDEELTAGLKALSRRHGTTLFMTLLAGWAVVLARLSGQEEVVVGSPMAGRGRREIEGLIGFFINTLAIRVDLSGGATVAEVLGRVKARVLEAQQHQDIPFEQVVELVDPVRSLSHHPLFQVMFTWQSAAQGGGAPLPGLEAGGVDGGGQEVLAKFGLSLQLGERNGRIRGNLTYATALFDRETVERHAGYLRRVLEEMAAHDGGRVERLALMPEGERSQVLEEWSRAEAAHPGDACVHELFAARAARTPGAAAVVFEGARLTYAELDARANRLARHLRARGVRPEVPVGVCLEWHPELVVSILAIFKAGGVYVPLDPALPAERLAYMAADAGLGALVTRAPLAGLVPCPETVLVDADAERIAAERDDPPAGRAHPASAAYVIYTSGSTGRPKGVAVEHGPMAAHLSAMGRYLGIVPEDRVLQFASAGFDVSFEQVFLPLLGGAALVLRGPERWSPEEFAERARGVGVTVADLSPAYWQEVLAAGRELPGVRAVTVGGEALPPAAARPPAGTRLVNAYGPTETVVGATVFDVGEGFSGATVPIGRPLPGRSAYVLDAFLQPVPPGVAGELYLGGSPLARGYLGRPGLTAERFVPDPFGAPGGRLYRTGDRARWNAGGELEFLGRTDFQVKIRGFRIEPGEIEARLAEHPDVRDAVVLVREDAGGERRLVAYYTGDGTADGAALRRHLSERVPEYMVPAAYVRLDALPLTPNGKVDRGALPAPEGEARAAGEHEVPVGEVETALAEIWAELLGAERVGRRDNFFELGGHSLLAVRVISRVRKAMEVELSLDALFETPVLSALAGRIVELRLGRPGPAGVPAAPSAIEPADRTGPLPLSFAQQRLWFLEQLGNLGSMYHIPTRLRLRGELDRGALARALDRIVERHEALRTTFAEVDGVPEQRIAPAGASGFHLAEHDLGGRADAEAELGRVVAEEARAPFDLQRGPLIRGRLVRLAADDHVLLLTMHHIVSDDWSMGVLTRELSALYAACREGREADLPALEVQYADYAVWQRRRVEGRVLQEQADYWARTLAGAPELLELPTDHPRPAERDHAGARFGVALDEELTAGLRALALRHGTTLYMTLLAGWAVVLGRLSGQDDVVVGTPMAGRGRREVEELIGFFVNTLALRLDLSGAPTVAELLGRVKERTLEAQRHQDIPFEQVVELAAPVRSQSHTPLFQALFAWQNAPRGDGLSLPGVELGGVGAGAAEVRAKFDLSLSLREAGDRITGSVTYAAALFERETVERWAGYLRRVLEEMAADEGRRLDRLALMPEGERVRVVEEWNRTEAEYPAGSCIHELFEAHVERAPDAVAVVFGGEHLSYAEVNRRANRLAHRLRALDVGPEVRVGICLERGVEMMVGVLAVLKAGGAYVPFDPAFPAERLRYMLEDSAPHVVLTQASLAGFLEGAGAPLLVLDGGAAPDAGLPETNPGRAGLAPEHLAYVIYTSGSTGRPKGVMVPHRGVVNSVEAFRGVYRIVPGARVLLFAPLYFDASVLDIFTAFASGAVLVVGSDEELVPGDALIGLLRRLQVTHAKFTPSVLAALPDAHLPELGAIMTGGDACPAEVVERWAPGRRFYNGCGATEVSVRTMVMETGDATRPPPIGRAVANVRLYVVDALLQPVPVGVAGEMCVGGIQVTRGYLNRPGLTADRFVPDPYGGEPGARLYRTGDRVRWLPDGNIEFLGRTDFQVKVRGFRIELGEIEARLAEHPGVREAVVLAREDGPGGAGEKRLVAYYVGADGAVEVESLRGHLGERLPEYMVPAAYVRLEQLPLTPAGKLDRGALPAPDGDAYAAREYEEPVGETEQALAEIWAEVLHAERVGRRDDFFELGGHSLLAVQVISRVRQVLEAEVALGELFTHPVLADFARALETAARAELPPVEPAPREGRVPLSFAQQRLWFLERLGSLGGAYHVSKRQRLRGELDRGALARALDRIVARHESLRTTFTEVDGVPEQRIAPADAGFLLVEHDLGGRADARAELGRLVAQEARAPFDLERGPLIRGRLVRLAPDDHVLLVTMHHIVSDGWSMGVLTRELSALYAAFRRGAPDPLPALGVQYADYALWQRRWVGSEVLRAQADYWARTLAGAPELLELPADHPRPARMDPAGAQLGVVLDEALTAGLKALSRRNGTTLFMTLLAGWAVVLGRLSGQADVVVGTPTAGRGRREIEGLIGFFVNTLALRLDLSGAPTVAEVLGRVKKRALEAQHHQDIPFEQVVERVDPARSLAHSPLFQVLFAWQNTPRAGGLSLPGLEPDSVGAAPSHVEANRDLSLSLHEAGGRIAGSVLYATALFERETVERWVGYLRRVLEEMASDEGRPVERLALMPESERARVVEEWNRTEAEYPAGSCIHELFEAHAERAPDATAVVFGGEHLTYAGLNARANRLARHLRSLGVGPDARVAVCVERSPEMVVGLLAVLKAGGAYVPLDPGYPAERLEHMLADSAPAAVLTEAALRGRVEGAGVPVLELDAAAPAWADEPAADPECGALTPGHLAYVIYTSGSTGTPKGVAVEHRAVVSQLAWAQRTWALGASEAVLQRISFSFDVSVRELFWPLAVGARMVLAPPAGHNDPGELVKTIAREGVGAVHAVPSLLQALLEHPDVGACASLARVMCGGEVLSPALARRFHERLPNATLYHMYGPTETTVAVTAAACRPGEPNGRVPLGRPVANTRAYVLDGRGEPVPVGVAGELCIGGAQVARGYLGRPEQTAERFVADGFGAGPGARLYRTGDLARWLPDGTLEFLGRTDHQVKVRGFRVEPGEIEARLREHPGVREAVVLVREDAPGEKRLVAYLVGGEAAGAEVLRAHLAGTLPEYMVPAAYVRLDEWPLTPNGKVDREALPAPEGDAYAARAYEAPVGETEQALAEIWAEVLGVERVGRRDDFFELGGHSLLAVQVISRVRQVLEAEASLGELFTRPVLADFARELEAAARAALPPIEPAPREGRVPLSFAQQRLWFLERLGNLGSTYHMRTRLRLRGELDRGALARALDRVVERHEALRTTFAQVDGVPEQRIAPAGAGGFHLAEHDLDGRADAKAELDRLLAEEGRARFDLERGPLIRGRLVRLAADDHVLLLTMHHIVSDDWSMGVLTRELSALYAAHRQGREAELPALPVQYADYAAWQRRWVEGRVLQEQADYWADTLAGAPGLLELPTDHPRPAQPDHAGAQLGVGLDEALTAGLKALSRRNGTTLFMTLLAGWAVVLGRLSGQDDVVVGTPTAGRGRREIEGLIGFFINTLAIRVDLSGGATVAEVLGRVKARALGAQHHQDIPFEQVVERVDPVRSLSHSPLFQVTFAWQNAPRGSLELPGLALGRVDAPDARGTVKQDLGLSLSEANGRIVGSVMYATGLFERATVERWAGYLRRVLEEMASGEGRRVERLALMSESERVRVVEEWNRTEAEYPAGSCVHELFERQVERAPDAAAVLFESRRVSYGELNGRANRLARHLRRLGVGPDVRVAICVERGPEMVAAMLAVLKAGGAYVPLDAGYPAERLEYMLADSAPAVVLTQEHLNQRLGAPLRGTAAPVVLLDTETPSWASEPEADLDRGGLTPGHPAYVIYTSGSTGRPKGVLVPHRGVCNVAAAQQRAFGVGPGDRVLQFASPSFDAAAFELVMALASGAALCAAPREELLPGPGLLALLRRHAVTTVTLPPSALAALPVEDLPALRTLTVAGEALPTELAARWGARHRLLNLYGPTEATIWSTAAECADPARRPDIGGPIANVRAYVVDAGLEPLPVGVAGELCVGGAGVALGYLGRPGLTAERFVPDPFGGEAGARLYRTGDRVRRLADGRLDFVGRTDHQVKVRGFRIEPGEIEARLVEHAGVREAVVVAREDTPGEKRLVAYVVGEGAVEVESLRAHLGETLPEYMVPAAYLRLDELPRTPGGKLDRGALPAPEGDAYARRAYEAPVGETEELLAQVWGEVLGVERVGRRDDFFELGGHSLLAVQVISLLEVDIDLGELFNRPVLQDFARELEKAGRAELPPIEPAPREGRVPLSFAQQRLWFLEQLGALGSAYHLPTRLRLRGALDRGALARALDGIVARHEALRTTFPAVDGVPEQRIAPAEAFRFPLAEHDLGGEADAAAGLDRLMAEEARAPFDLERGPLVRGRLIRVGRDDHVLLLTMHHIVSDGWSMGVFTRELSALYAAHAGGREAELPELPVQYADYAAWQRRWVEGEVLREQSDYWTRTLAGVPELLELPADHPRPARMSHAGAQLGVVLDEELTAALKALSRRRGTTLFMTLLAGWAVVLGRLSGRDDVVVGTPTAGRGRREIDELIGFFVNTLALRVDLSGAPTGAELLGRVKKRALDAQHRQDIPFEQVVELVSPARSMAHTPIFQVMFTWQNAPGGGVSLPGVEVDGMRSRSPQVHAKFDLSLSLQESGDRIVGGFTYATALFERETVERHAGYLRRVLGEMAADEGRPVERLPLLPADERSRVLEEWNRTEAEYPAGSCLHELFELRASRAPDAVAVVFEGEPLAYGELNRRANRLAHHLRSLGVGPEARVGLLVERGPGMVVAMLAVLKAGGAYVPLDPGHPAERLEYLLADSAPAVVLTQKELRGRVEGAGVPVLELDAAAPEWAGRPGTDPERGALTPAHPAYVIHTSGSTGRPKGVVVPHRGVVNLLRSMGETVGMAPADRVLAVTTYAFDISVLEIFLPLLHGAATLVLPRERAGDPAALAEAIRGYAPTVMQATPATWRMLVGAGWEGAPEMRALCGGEALPAELASAVRGRVGALWNVYGPTETTIWSTAQPVPGDSAGNPGGRVPIGRPVANTRVYLLDEAGEPVPAGVAGELHIGGAGVARGYLGRPELTAERFVADAYGAEPGARLYRTGDLARWLPDGTIEYLGRTDHQVKVRGFRIEPGEIEARLAEHAGVRQAVVLAREDVPGDTRLVAYLVGDGAAGGDVLRAHLGQTLPEYMVPAAYVWLEALPLTPNGKLDRAALPAPDAERRPGGGYVAPATPVELQLVNLWEEVLGVRPIGTRDNFFDLGGNSLLAPRIVARARERFGCEIPLAELVSGGTVAHLAGVVAGRAAGRPRRALVPIQPGGSRPPLYLVHAISGEILLYVQLARYLGADQPVYGLQDPWLGGERPPFVPVEGIAERYLAELREVQPSGPYHIGGYSFGGAVAFEMARQLRAAGEEVGSLVVLDTEATSRRPLATRPPEEDTVAVREMWMLVHDKAVYHGIALPKEVPDMRHLTYEQHLEAALAKLKALNLAEPDAGPEAVLYPSLLRQMRERVLSLYRPGPYDGPLTLFRVEDEEPGEGRAGKRRPAALGWDAVCSRPVEIVPVRGNHLTLTAEPSVGPIAALWRQVLDRAGAGHSAPPEREEAPSS